MQRTTDINVTRDSQREVINKESEVKRPLLHSLAIWGALVVGLFILMLEMALIGRQIGLVLILCGLAFGVMSLKLEYDETNKRYRLPYEKIASHWILVVQIGVVLVVIALIDAIYGGLWWPVWWQFGDGRLWVSTSKTSTAYPGWVMLIRFFFILALGGYYPIAPLTVWRFAAEIVLPQLPNIRFRPVTAEGLNAPYFGEILEPLEYEEEAPPQNNSYSERWIPKPQNGNTGKHAATSFKVVRVPDRIATTRQLEELACGVLREGFNFSRNYWTTHGLFTDPGWRKFQQWMFDNGYVEKSGNAYKLNDEGEKLLETYLSQ